MLASMGSRRRFGIFGLFGGRNGANEHVDADLDGGNDSESETPYVAHSMLGDLASHAPARVAVQLELDPESEKPFVAHTMLGDLASHAPARIFSQEDPDPDPETHSMLALETPEAEAEPVPAAEKKAPARPAEPLVFGHAGLHSTVGELAGLEEHIGSDFPIERFILVSLVAHLVLVILLIVAPTKIPAGKDFFAAFQPPPKDNSPIPVIFTDATGQARENPKKSPLSDADRRAGGGDPSKPKAATPFSPPTGVAGLAPGPRGPRVPGSPQPSQPSRTAPGARASAQAQARAPQGEARSAPGEARPTGAQAPQSAEAKPSDFPNMTKPMAPASPTSPMKTGPQETTRLAGLDTAIREAARGAVGGEGGSAGGDPEGGFVDSGPVSFDTSWYDWGPYAAEMVRRIKLHWDVPELARLGWKGSLTVRFFILADGTVADAKILRGSGVPPFDFAAFQAIVKSSPFRPLPTDLHSTREGVTVTFFYNMRPEMEKAEGTAR
jgi:TonB family protein